MKNSLYIIEYEIHDVPKSFIVRAEVMNNAEAWHWAACDVGIGIIPRFRNEKIKRISKPMGERYGLTNVRWRPSGSIPFIAQPYVPPPPEMNAMETDPRKD